MTNITWAESEHEYPNGAAWPYELLNTYPTIQSARENSRYPFPEQAYLYCIQDGLVLGSCELRVQEHASAVRKYIIVTAHRVGAGRKYMIASRLSSEFYDTHLEYAVLKHIRQANEHMAKTS